MNCMFCSILFVNHPCTALFLSIIRVPPSPPLPQDNREFTVVRIFSFSYRGGRGKNSGVNGKKLFAIFSTAAPTLHDYLLAS